MTDFTGLSFELLYALALAMVMRVLYCVFWKHRESYSAAEDAFPVHFQLLYCMLMPMLLGADLNMGVVKDYLWNACMWLETTALLPQVYMIAKKQVEVDALISHFVAATAASRFVDLCYWYFAFSLLTPASGGVNYSGWLIVSCHVMHALLLADFMYYYMKFRLSGKGGLFTAMPLPEQYYMV